MTWWWGTRNTLLDMEVENGRYGVVKTTDTYWHLDWLVSLYSYYLYVNIVHDLIGLRRGFPHIERMHLFHSKIAGQQNINTKSPVLLVLNPLIPTRTLRILNNVAGKMLHMKITICRANTNFNTLSSTHAASLAGLSNTMVLTMAAFGRKGWAMMTCIARIRLVHFVILL